MIKEFFKSIKSINDLKKEKIINSNTNNSYYEKLSLKAKVFNDLERVLQEYIDTGNYSNVTVEFNPKHKEFVLEKLDNEGIKYLILDDARIKLFEGENIIE